VAFKITDISTIQYNTWCPIWVSLYHFKGKKIRYLRKIKRVT